jgi:glycosyltransferase involved in cell wall biosynthesis
MKNIIISPSGHLYGSENVLFDFLKGSTNNYIVYAPAQSVLLQKLKGSSFDNRGFKNLKILYLKIFIQLLFQRRNLILNESGHIKYIKVLAKLLPFPKLVVIIRLLEDCNANLNDLPNNIELIAVSNFIKEKVVSNRPVHVIYDPFFLIESSTSRTIQKSEKLNIGIIGRLTESKGLNNFVELIRYLSHDQKNKLNFLFYGTYDDANAWFKEFKYSLSNEPNLNYQLMGFESNQEKLFNSIDIVLHLNKNEPLGRILFEAINYNLAFLCFRQGGTGELACELGLEKNTFLEVSEIPHKLDKLPKKGNANETQRTREIIKEKFNPALYAQKIDFFLSGKTDLNIK